MNKIVFFGTEDFSAPSLRALLAANYDIVAVVTKSDTVRGRGHKIDSPIVAKIARDFNSQNPTCEIKIFQPAKLSEIENDLRELRPEVGVLVAYGKIIPQSVIDVFPHGIINVHPSLLPKYRGPSPMETAIANGDRETGITIMALAKEMDAGPIYYQEKIKLLSTETRPEIYAEFSRRGAELIIEKLSEIISGELQPIPQNDSEATYCQLLTRDDGILNPHIMTAAECDRRVRAYLGWPRTRLNFHGRNVIVTKTKVLGDFAGDNWPDVVKCKNETALQIVELIAPSGRTMKTADYLRGLRK